MATVDFSDVVTYDGAAMLAQASFSAAENSEPTPSERLWELVTNAVAFLADHYGAHRDEFIPSVLALAMPTLLECKTLLNPEGQMDLVEQGVWGRSFRGQQVFGIRDAARKVARGDYDEWRYRTALIAALRHVEAMGYSAVRLHLPGDCGLYANLGCPDPFWREVVQLVDEVGATCGQFVVG
jgi:hypothetical protein